MKTTTHIKIKSLNKQLKAHWGKRHKERKNWEKAIWAAINQCAICAPRGIHFRTVEIISYRKDLLDFDNLVGGCKPIVDSLVKLGLIKNDDPLSVAITYDQIQSKDEKTEIIFY